VSLSLGPFAQQGKSLANDNSERDWTTVIKLRVKFLEAEAKQWNGPQDDDDLISSWPGEIGMDTLLHPEAEIVRQAAGKLAITNVGDDHVQPAIMHPGDWRIRWPWGAVEVMSGAQKEKQFEPQPQPQSVVLHPALAEIDAACGGVGDSTARQS
jgi:hypothetical protein